MSHHRARIRATATLLFAIVAATTACNSSHDSGGPTAPPPPPPPPPTTWTQLIGRSFSASPMSGASFLCTELHVTSDHYITGFRTTSDNGEYRLYLTVADTTFNPLGDFPCSAGNRDPRVLYASGIGTSDILFPAGVAVHVRAGQYLELIMQLYNPTANTESGSTDVLVQEGKSSDVVHEADLLIGGRVNFTPIPAGKYALGGGCSAPQTFQVFAQIPLMNLIGTGQVDWTATGPVGDTILVDSTYSVLHQQYVSLETPFTVHKNDQFIIDCKYDNETGHVVAYGESVDLETCLDGIYRYPAPTADSIFDCITD